MVSFLAVNPKTNCFVYNGYEVVKLNFINILCFLPLQLILVELADMSNFLLNYP